MTTEKSPLIQRMDEQYQKALAKLEATKKHAVKIMHQKELPKDPSFQIPDHRRDK